jgi:4-amino-4-deoxy-L-arabinose transferase-like glycosyltransferase
MRRQTFALAVVVILVVASGLRFVWLKSDPPTVGAGWVGVVWHDEGAWVHNARNRALWGAWRTDNWNPVFVTPVFTALEYGAFEAFGVGTWQARAVPIISGLTAIAFLMLGLHALSGRRAAAIGGALLATNYVFVMWNRAALMESTMTAFLVVSWAGIALSAKRPSWGLLAGVAAALAWFTKASAAFYIAAIAIEIALSAVFAGPLTEAGSGSSRSWKRPLTPAGTFVLIGLALSAAVTAVLFVWPHWPEYRFYNWQMSVLRKPEYSARALMDRASWLPIVNDFFMWMWPVLAVGTVALLAILTRWRGAKPSERVLVLWMIVGLVELVIHDSGNERRYVMFIPALIALSANALGGGSLGMNQVAAANPRWRWLAIPVLLGLSYLVAGSAVRFLFLDQIHAHQLHRPVVLAAAIAALVTGVMVWRWRQVADTIARWRPAGGAIAAVMGVTILADAVHFSQWAAQRREANYEASREVGRLLPAGTLVQGKLANGLALENRIRPIFIGHGFGNYDDRLQRDDVRYILTYVSPTVGFESQAGSDMIQDLLNHYPAGRWVATFDVNETGPANRAALFDKVPGSDPRARD